MKYHNDYSNKWYFEKLTEIFEGLELVQLVDFITWTRLVNTQWRRSVLDHICVRDATLISNLLPVETVLGDHKLITITIDESKAKQDISIKWDWHNYTKEL